MRSILYHSDVSAIDCFMPRFFSTLMSSIIQRLPLCFSPYSALSSSQTMGCPFSSSFSMPGGGSEYIVSSRSALRYAALISNSYSLSPSRAAIMMKYRIVDSFGVVAYVSL